VTLDGVNIGWWDQVYYLNLNCVDAASNLMSLAPTSSTVSVAASVIGLQSPVSVSSLLTSNVLIGVNYPVTGGSINLGAASVGDGAHERICYNTKVYSIAMTSGSARTITKGMAFVQVLSELVGGAGATCFNILSDGDLTTCSNVIEFHNGGFGERCSHFYNDVSGTKVIPSGIQKKGVAKFCIWDNFNIKTETFTLPSAPAGSVGNWAYTYQVGNHGNVSLFGAVQRIATDAPHNDNSDVPYMGAAWQADSEPNLQLHGLTKAQIMALFTNYTAAPQAVPAAGGNYQPVHGAQYLTSRVPAGQSVLKYDIAGNARLTDGTGAAGPYEQAA
jgi:hypothetical protein